MCQSNRDKLAVGAVERGELRILWEDEKLVWVLRICEKYNSRHAIISVAIVHEPFEKLVADSRLTSKGKIPLVFVEDQILFIDYRDAGLGDLV